MDKTEVVLQNLQTRRSVRAYLPKQVEEAALEAVLTAGTYAPTGMNRQAPVIVAVQETEGAVLSPRLVGGATSLHPMAVLLLVSAGGLIGGALGMVLVIPAVVSIRGAVRGWRE